VINGNLCTIKGSDTGNGTSNTTGKTWQAPITSGSSGAQAAYSWAIDNGTQTHGTHILPASSSTITSYVGPATGTTWTAEGNCRVLNGGMVLTYEL
jgi:hypothetical protein